MSSTRVTNQPEQQVVQLLLVTQNLLELDTKHIILSPHTNNSTHELLEQAA